MSSKVTNVIKVDIDMEYCTVSAVLDFIKLRILKYCPKLIDIVQRINVRASTRGRIHVWIVLKKPVPEPFNATIAYILGDDVHRFVFNMKRWRFVGQTCSRLFIAKSYVKFDTSESKDGDELLRKFIRVYYVERDKA